MSRDFYGDCSIDETNVNGSLSTKAQQNLKNEKIWYYVKEYDTKGQKRSSGRFTNISGSLLLNLETFIFKRQFH